MKQKPYMNGREKWRETKPFRRKKKRKKKNIGRCYSKLLTQFTNMKGKEKRHETQSIYDGREKRHETKAIYKGKGKTA